MTATTWRQRRECWRAARLLQRHLDGELGLLSGTRISRHLRRCRRCGMEADVYRFLRAALHASRPDAAAEAEAVARLRCFAAEVSSGGAAGGTDDGRTATGS